MALNTYTNAPSYESYIHSYRGFLQTFYLLTCHLLFMYLFDESCSYQLWHLSYTAHKCNTWCIYKCIFAWMFFQVSWCDDRRAAACSAPKTVQKRPSDPQRQIPVSAWAGRAPERAIQRTCGVRKEHGEENKHAHMLHCDVFISRSLLDSYLLFSPEWSRASWQSCSD